MSDEATGKGCLLGLACMCFSAALMVWLVWSLL
jgi:hypothetical protein